MSKSYKRNPVIKGNSKQRSYNRIARNKWKKITRGIKTTNDLESIEYPKQNETSEIWNFCDWIFKAFNKSISSFRDNIKRALTKK